MPNKLTLSALIVFALSTSSALIESLTPTEFDKTPAGQAVQHVVDAVKGLAKAGAPSSDEGRVVTEDELIAIIKDLVEDFEQLVPDDKSVRVDLRVVLALDLGAQALGWARTNAESTKLEALAGAGRDLLRDIGQLARDGALSSADAVELVHEALDQLREVL
jgi:hypothetical protein